MTNLLSRLICLVLGHTYRITYAHIRGYSSTYTHTCERCGTQKKEYVEYP